MIFLSIITASLLSSWPGILLNSAITARNVYQKRTQDIFFLPLYPLGRAVPLFPVIIIGGFIALLGMPSAILVGMTIAHLGTDILLLTLRNNATKLQTLVDNYAPQGNELHINLSHNDNSN
jgi:hypothetical protein